MRWYADNSELNGIRGAAIPDILLFGGISVAPKDELPLKSAIEAVKAKYGHARAPVKWNFKDLRKTYESRNHTALYEKMLASSKDWREETFDAASAFDYTVIMSCVQSNSVKVPVIKGVKPFLTRYCFANGLMRVALHAEETKPDRYLVILDWPDGGNSKPFDGEYMSAYGEGKTSDRTVEYHSGPLSALNFSDAVCYSNMRHSTLLQFADLAMGACREFIECAIGKKATGFGVDMTKKILPKYRGYSESKVYGRGISVASNDAAFKNAIKAAFDLGAAGV